MKVGLITDPIYLKHDTGEHVENSRRLEAIIDLLKASALFDKLVPLSPRPATVEELALVHNERQIDLIQRASSGNGHWLDGDTFASPDSFQVALQAAGGVLQGIDAIMEGQIEHAFALVRPPGHHATADRAMGFCLFNNIAVGAAYAVERHKLERVLIADFDVHHGNGTEAIFYGDPRVLYFSTHQYPHYPGTGSARDHGAGRGKGTTVNVPLAAGAGDLEYIKAYDEILAQAAREHKPDFIFVSAGYDAHWADPLSGMQLTVEGYAGIVKALKALADDLCGGRLLIALEGGYHLQALAWSVRASLEALLGIPPTPDPLGKPR